MLAIGGGFGWWHVTSSEGQSPASTGTSGSATAFSRPLPSLPGDPLPNAGGAAAATVEPIAARVPQLMETWRAAIINKDADAVQSLDQAFAAHPREFISALMASAEGDPEDRVRSFSTRVLGKLRSGESSELMRRLLADRSEYVRFNAAWAIGEMADREATSRLRALANRDPSPSVRQSAQASLRKIEGG